MPLLSSITGALNAVSSSQYVIVNASGSSVNEGSSITFTIQAFGIADGTTLYYDCAGSTVVGDDVTGAPLSGSFVLGNGSNTVSFSFVSDSATEGTETMIFNVYSGSLLGPKLASSGQVTVLDTSVAAYGSMVFRPTNLPMGNNSIDPYTWTVPSGVYSVSIVCIGPGASGAGGGIYTNASGGGGGALSYLNNVAVTPGEDLYVTVGQSTQIGYQNQRGGNSSVFRVTGNVFLVGARGGVSPWESPDGNPNGTANNSIAYRVYGANGSAAMTGSAPNQWSSGGGEGGRGGNGVTTTRAGGGGGAGGYAGNGGGGGSTAAGVNGSGGGGGGGGSGTTYGGGGGGASPYGQQSDGVGGTAGAPGAKGGGGLSWNINVINTSGQNYPSSTSRSNTGAGGVYGGGGAGYLQGYWTGSNDSDRSGMAGVVRIVWPGLSRQFPSTDVASTTNETLT